MRTRVQLCGAFVLEIAGRPVDAVVRGHQARLLFAYLVLHRQRPVRREELIEALWADEPPALPDGALRTIVSRLRSVVGPGVICGRSDLTLALPAGAWVDIEAASDAILRAEHALDGLRWEEATGAAQVALAVAERGFFGDVDAGWVELERRRLEEVRLRALECLAACGLAVGGARLSDTERAARRLIEAAPYRETGYRYLMQALAQRGRIAEALMSRQIRRAFTALGVFGHLARMVVFGLVGYGLVEAAIEYDPRSAIGLDGALSKLSHQSYRPVLLGVVAVGLIGFALYSIADARYRKI